MVPGRPVKSRLINDSFSKSQHLNFMSWLTIGLLGNPGNGTWGFAKASYKCKNCLLGLAHSLRI